VHHLDHYLLVGIFYKDEIMKMNSKQATLYIVIIVAQCKNLWKVKSDYFYAKPLKITAMKSLVEGSSFQMTTFPVQDEEWRGEGNVGLYAWRSNSLHTCLSSRLIF
jgi:hypothetical protein